MDKLYKLLTKELSAIHANVGFEFVQDDTNFPYVTYRFVNSSPLYEGDRDDTIIEIDVWSKYEDGKDAVMEIETITSQISDSLRKKRQFEDGAFFLFHLINRLNVPDEDNKILRRQLRFRVRQYN